MFERLRQTHPRLGKAAYDAWDLANPLAVELRCPTCGARYPQPLRAVQEDRRADLTGFGQSSAWAAPWAYFVTCHRDHKWSVTHVTYGPDWLRVHLGHYLGGGEYACAPW